MLTYKFNFLSVFPLNTDNHGSAYTELPYMKQTCSYPIHSYHRQLQQWLQYCSTGTSLHGTSWLPCLPQHGIAHHSCHVSQHGMSVMSATAWHGTALLSWLPQHGMAWHSKSAMTATVRHGISWLPQHGMAQYSWHICHKEVGIQVVPASYHDLPCLDAYLDETLSTLTVH